MGSFVVSQEIRAVLNDRDRLRALYDLALIDSAGEPVFDSLTQLVSRIIDVPISVMSMVGDEYQFFKSAVGVGDLRSTPLSHAFCKHVVADGTPLIVDDARVHPVLHDNGSIKDHGVVGYLGIPLKIASGKTLGSFCAVDTAPHQWTDVEIDIMREVAEIVKYEIEARALTRGGSMSQQQLAELHESIIAFTENFDTTMPRTKMAEAIRRERVRLFES